MENMRIKWLEKLKNLFFGTSYTCDLCGTEVFSYPVPRICGECESALSGEYFTCDKCGRPSVTQGLCLNCKSQVPEFDKGISAFAYHGLAARALNRLKEGEPHLAAFFGEKMSEAVVKSGLAVENATITFVPLHKDRKKTRGYDQAEKLAQVVAKKLSLPLEETLTCVGKKEKQKELTLSERRKNVSGVYRVIEKKNAQDKTYLLVDDIMTTGATGSECAARLKKAGAKSVYFLTVAALPERK